MQTNTYPNIRSFGTNVSGANTATQIKPTPTPCKKVDLQAVGGDIYVGDSTIDATKGNFIPSGASFTLYIEDLSPLYIYSASAGAGVIGNYYF